LLTEAQTVRTGDVWWCLRHWADVLSDMSVYHRLSPVAVAELDPPTLFGLAVRLVHYGGVVQAVALAAHRRERGAVSAAPTAPVVPTDPTPDQVRAMRDAARRRKFDPSKYGEHKHVGLDEFMGVASRG
jgi:hypothetical protein